MIRAVLALLAVLLVAGTVACGATATPEFEPWPPEIPAQPLPPLGEYAGVPGPKGGTILEPASRPVADGQSYAFSLGHCGLASPVDIDGSFWNATEGRREDGAPMNLDADPEAINATAGVIALVGDEARFRTESGGVIRFARHPGEKEFPGCD